MARPATSSRPPGDGTEAAAEPSDASDWVVDGSGESFTITNLEGRQLSVVGDGALVTVAAGSAGANGVFSFREASGCATYPEVEVNATGGPSTGSPSYGEVSGLLEGHMHGMAFEFLGGRAHCGRAWHRFGAPYALRRLRRPRAERVRRGRSRTSSTATRPAATTPSAGRRSTTGRTQVADPRAVVLQVDRTGVARRPAHLREPLRREPRPLRALPAQAEQLRRDGQRRLQASASTSCRTTSTPRAAAPARAGSGSSTTPSRRAR